MMGESTATLPSSFQPWLRHEPAHKSFTSTLSRIHAERGHFRTVTEAGLQEEINLAAVTNGIPASPASSADDDETGQIAATGPTITERRGQLAQARQNVLTHIASAQNETLIALDFVSLLLSKDSKQAEATMSPVLKESVPLGSLGMDVWAGMVPDPAMEETDRLLCRGQRMRFLGESADALMKASQRLRQTVDRETRYWQGIQGIKDQGWNVCRLPRDGLGVRYGFSEARGDFARRGTASLKMGLGGQVLLDRGYSGDDKSLRVRITRSGQTIAENARPNDTADEHDASARIKAARDSLFDEELWHEAMQESRDLASSGVFMRGGTIVLPLPGSADEMAIAVDLVPQHNPSAYPSPLASALATSLRVMLTHTHTQRLRQRSQIPAPLSSAQPVRATASILRPILTLTRMYLARTALSAALERMSIPLRAAGLECHIDSSWDLLARLRRTESEEDLLALLRDQDCPSISTMRVQFPDSTELSTSHRMRLSIAVRPEGARAGVEFALSTDRLDVGRQELGLSDTSEEDKSGTRDVAIILSSFDAVPKALRFLLSGFLSDVVGDVLRHSHADGESELVVRHGPAAETTEERSQEVLVEVCEVDGGEGVRLAFHGRSTVWKASDCGKKSILDAAKDLLAPDRH